MNALCQLQLHTANNSLCSAWRLCGSLSHPHNPWTIISHSSPWILQMLSSRNLLCTLAMGYQNEGRYQPLEENGKWFEHPKLPANFEIPHGLRILVRHTKSVRMLITISYVQSKCKAWLGIERISVKRQTLVYFDAILLVVSANFGLSWITFLFQKQIDDLQDEVGSDLHTAV